MKTVELLLWAALLCGVLAQDQQQQQARSSNTVNEEDNEVEDSGNMRVVYKLVVDCLQKEDISVCLKMKAVNFLDRALALRAPLPIMDFVTLARDPNAPESEEPARPLTEAELDASLPRSLDEKSSRLDQILMDKVDQLLRTRSLQLALPQDAFEGRKKNKGYGMLLAGGAAMAGMMMQMALGKIALIAGKALMVAKIALVLSAVIGLKKLLGGGGGGGESHPQVVYASEHGGGWSHRRSLDSDVADAAHDLAYSAHVKPAETS